MKWLNRLFARNKQQKQASKNLKEAWKVVLENIEGHIDLNEPRIWDLHPYELILGSTQILWENKLIKEGKAFPLAMIMPSPQQENNIVPVEQKEDKKTWH